MDAKDVLMVIVDRDRAGRVSGVETYEPGASPPSWAEDYLPHDVRQREVQAKDPRKEVKESSPIAWHKGSGYYDLESGPQDGESVRGKDSVPDSYEIRQAE